MESYLRRIFLLFAGIFIFLCGRLFQLQAVRGSYYVQISEKNRQQTFFLSAPRGQIIDRNGNVLAGSHSIFVLLFAPFEFTGETLDELSQRLSDILRIPLEELRKKLQSAYRSYSVIRVAEGLSRDIAFHLLEESPFLPGVTLIEESRRFYPYDKLIAHVLGYIGEISPAELEYYLSVGYRRGEWIGKSGVEKTYEQFLRGEPGGFQIEVDARGRHLRFLNQITPRSGNDVVLTLDVRLQLLAEEMLDSQGYRGAIVAVIPRNGEILALASRPTFSPNIFVDLNLRNERQRALSDPVSPLLNRVIQAQCPPGSVFKIVTTLAALSENRIEPKTVFFCPGYFNLGNRTFHCWEEKGHNQVNLLAALTNSCDVYYYRLGLRVGIDLLSRYARACGLGQPSKVDLPSEQKGVVGDRAWKKQRYGASWFEGDTVNMAIGQGYLVVTPLQIADLVACVANQGEIWQPHIFQKAVNLQGEIIQQYAPKTLLNVKLSDPRVWEFLEQGLVSVVENGTGRAAYLPQIKIAGKTGTAQNPHGPEHAWFVAYAPAGKPQIAVVVFIEQGGHGGSVAAPIAQRLIAEYLRYKGIS